MTKKEAQFLDAASKGHIRKLKAFLDAGVDVNVQDTRGTPWNRTAVMHAAERGHLKVVDLLLKAGARVDAKDKGIPGNVPGGNTALILAIYGPQADGRPAYPTMLPKSRARLTHSMICAKQTQKLTPPFSFMHRTNRSSMQKETGRTKNSFTVVLSPIDEVVSGFRRWSEVPGNESPPGLRLTHCSRYRSFRRAWSAFGGIVDKGGVLFAGYTEHVTYGFSRWLGLTPLARWCNSTAISVRIQDGPEYVRYLELYEGEKLIRKIDLQYNPIERWYFHEVGDRFPFEDAAKLRSRINPKRFDTLDIEVFLSAVGRGACLLSPETFAHQRGFYLFQFATNQTHERRFPEVILSDLERKKLLSLEDDPDP